MSQTSLQTFLLFRLHEHLRLGEEYANKEDIAAISALRKKIAARLASYRPVAYALKLQPIRYSRVNINKVDTLSKAMLPKGTAFQTFDASMNKNFDYYFDLAETKAKRLVDILNRAETVLYNYAHVV